MIELASAWENLKSLHKGESFYAFGIYCNDVASWFNVAACSEEALDSIAAKQAKSEQSSSNELHSASLRWSLADSPLMAECEGRLPTSQAIRDAQPDPYEEADGSEEAIKAFFESAFQALLELDKTGIFGTSTDRDKLLLSIWINDESDEAKILSARRLNSEEQVLRYSNELASGYAAFKQLM